MRRKNILTNKMKWNFKEELGSKIVINVEIQLKTDKNMRIWKMKMMTMRISKEKKNMKKMKK